MDPRHLSRLQEEQRKAIQATRTQIEQYEKFKSDYHALQKRLKTLPDNISHEVMVPFGKFAFMPGEIVHTNEILVLLGDNWFAERSAKQAYHIAERRIQELDKRIQELKSQHGLLAPRYGVTSELQAEAQGYNDIKEIVEEFDEQKEKLWDEQHRKNVSRYHAEIAKKRSANANRNKDANSTVRSDGVPTSDDDLWKRLDDLEKQEAEKGELNSSFEEESDNDDNSKYEGTSSNHKVTWSDEKTEAGLRLKENSDGSTDTDDDGSEDHKGDSDEAASLNQEVKRTITFSHTKSTPSLPRISTPPSGSTSINSPGDIYQLFAPKSILKKSLTSEDTGSGALLPGDNDNQPSYFEETSFDHPQTDNTEAFKAKMRDSSSLSRDKAFTGQVVEKSTVTSTEQPSQGSVQEGRRMSKFKAQRLKQASSS